MGNYFLSSISDHIKGVFGVQNYIVTLGFCGSVDVFNYR